MKIISIEGMSCGHCTSSVEAALKALDGVEKVELSLENKEARVEGNVEDQVLREAVEAIGFDVTEIK